MAKDLGDAIGSALGQVAREAVQTVSSNNRRHGSNPLSGPAGLAAGAGLVERQPHGRQGRGGVRAEGQVVEAGDMRTASLRVTVLRNLLIAEPSFRANLDEVQFPVSVVGEPVRRQTQKIDPHIDGKCEVQSDDHPSPAHFKMKHGPAGRGNAGGA